MSSAAIRAESGERLREYEKALEPLKPGKPLHRKRDPQILRFWFAVPRQLDAWELPKVRPFSLCSAVFEVAKRPVAAELVQKVLTLSQESISGLETWSLSFGADGSIGAEWDAANGQWYMSLSPREDGSFELPLHLVTPWQSMPGSNLTLVLAGGQPREVLTEWDNCALARRFKRDEVLMLEFRNSSPEFRPIYHKALTDYFGNDIDAAYALIQFDVNQYHATLATLMETVPGFVDTGAFCTYRKGLDPYARPTEADQGHTVRFPLFNKDLRSRSTLQIDVVHRPAGDCLFDIQVINMDHPAKPPKELVKLLEKVEAPYEIWQGELLGRWE